MLSLVSWGLGLVPDYILLAYSLAAPRTIESLTAFHMHIETLQEHSQ